MTTPESRLAAAGLVLPPTPTRLGAYRPAVQVGELLFVSGQTGTRDGHPVWTGRCGDDLSIEDARRSAELAALNALLAIHMTVGLDRIRAIARLTVYVRSTPTFTDHPQVADAATAVFKTAFGPPGKSARSALGVASLPQGAPVELDVIAAVETS
ncbi:RidA family protein [Actinokineospora sp. NPDC004072]